MWSWEQWLWMDEPTICPLLGHVVTQCWWTVCTRETKQLNVEKRCCVNRCKIHLSGLPKGKSICRKTIHSKPQRLHQLYFILIMLKKNDYQFLKISAILFGLTRCVTLIQKLDWGHSSSQICPWCSWQRDAYQTQTLIMWTNFIRKAFKKQHRDTAYKCLVLQIIKI